MQTLDALLPILSWLTGAGAGWLASWLFDALRNDVLPDGRLVAWLLAPRHARYASMALAILISIAATAGIALIQGAPVLSAVDAALAGLIASQVRHARMSLPGSTPEFDFTPDLDYWSDGIGPEDEDNSEVQP